jgi:hypothetical protein
MMRRDWNRQIEGEADALIRDFGAEAYSVACQWGHETETKMMARVWKRVAAAIALRSQASAGADTTAQTLDRTDL